MNPLIRARALHILADSMLVLSAFSLAYFLRVGFFFSSDLPFWPYFFSSALAAAVWVSVLVVAGYYRLYAQSKLMLLALRVIGGVASVGALLAIHFFTAGTFFSRLMNLYALGLGLILLSLMFGLFLRWSQKTRQKRGRNTLIIGANSIAEKTILALRNDPYGSAKVVGCLSPYGIHKHVKGSEILGKLNALEPVCKRKNVAQIIQCDGFEHTINLAGFCAEKRLDFAFVPSVRGLFESFAVRPSSEEVSLLSFNIFPHEKTPLAKAKFWVLRHVLGAK